MGVWFSSISSVDFISRIKTGLILDAHGFTWEILQRSRAMMSGFVGAINCKKSFPLRLAAQTLIYLLGWKVPHERSCNLFARHPPNLQITSVWRFKCLPEDKRSMCVFDLVPPRSKHSLKSRVSFEAQAAAQRAIFSSPVRWRSLKGIGYWITAQRGSLLIMTLFVKSCTFKSPQYILLNPTFCFWLHCNIAKPDYYKTSLDGSRA